MRNLKRVLSLALATAMLFSMMVIGASAADKKPLTDLDKVNNKEAVNLMVDLGIIVGKPDGSFAPAELINRATMAKLITYIMMGDINPDLFAGVSTDLKDIDKNWAKGYIKFCYSNGIITGDGAGHFMPDADVTVVAAAKMLLVAIGYDAAVQGYVGTNWSVNIMREAKLAGLLDGVNAGTNEKLTRDNASRMIFNALFAETIKYGTQWDGGKAYKANPTGTGTTLAVLQYNLGKIESLVTGINANGTAVTTSILGTAADIAKNAVLNGKLAASPELMGGKVIAYYNTNTNKLVSTSLLAGSSTVLASTNEGINLTNATNRTHKDFLAEVETGAGTVKYFLNGASNNGTNPYGNGVIDTTVAPVTVDVSGIVANAGVIVDFVDVNGNGKADVVRITSKTVATVTEAPSTKAVTNNDTQVKVPGVINAFSGTNTVKTVVGYEGLKKDDVVLYVKIGNMTYIEKAVSVEGVAVAKNNNAGILVDGKYYYESGLLGKSYTAAAWTDYTNTYTFYLDNGNNIVKAVALTNTSTSNYGVLLEANWVAGGTLGSSNYAQARLLMADGTTEIVTINKIDGNTPIQANVVSTIYDATSGAGGLGINLAAGVTGTGYTMADNGTTANKLIGVDSTMPVSFYTYVKETDGKYTLTTKAAAAPGLAGVALTKDKANFAGAYIGNANTVFLVKTGTLASPVYTAYTGINNVPSMGAATGIVLNNAAGVATHVYISSTGTLTGSVGQYVYIPGTGALGTTIPYTLYPATTTAAAYYEIPAIFNGESTTIKLAAPTGNFSADWAGKAANTMYTVTSINTSKVISAMSATTTGAGVNVTTGIKANAGNTIVNSVGTAFTYDANTKVFVIGTDGTVTAPAGSAIKVDATDDLIVEFDATNNYAKTIYAIERIATTTAVSGIKVFVNGVDKTASLTGPATTTTGTLAGVVAGDVITVKAAVSNQGTSMVADYVVVAGDIGGAAITFTVNLTAENGLAVVAASYALTVTA